MARRITDITRSGGKRTRTEVEGLRELEAKVRDLLALDDTGSLGQRSARVQRARKELYGVLGEGAAMLKREIQSRAEARGWPKAVIAAVFTYADARKDQGKRRQAALAGIRKGAPPRRDMKIYREWFPGRSRSRRAKKLVIPGTISAKGAKYGLQKIGMSLAAMFEFGTSKMAARPAFRPALKAVQSTVLQQIAGGYKRVIETLAGAA